MIRDSWLTFEAKFCPQSWMTTVSLSTSTLRIIWLPINPRLHKKIAAHRFLGPTVCWQTIASVSQCFVQPLDCLRFTIYLYWMYTYLCWWVSETYVVPVDVYSNSYNDSYSYIYIHGWLVVPCHIVDWLTDNLLHHIQSNPDILRRLADPVFMSAITEFQTNPQAAMHKYRDNAAIQSFFKEFCGLLGRCNALVETVSINILWWWWFLELEPSEDFSMHRESIRRTFEVLDSG